MSRGEEHDEYIAGLEKISGACEVEKATELRLGLPGCESERNKISLFGKECNILKGFVSAGAKRVSSDANGKWGLSINAGSDSHPAGVTEPLFSNNGGCSPVELEQKNNNNNTDQNANSDPPASNAQVVGWPPIRCFRKNTLATNMPIHMHDYQLYVKVSMDGAPYLRKIDLKTYPSYAQLSSALENMFTCFTIGQYGHEEGLSERHLMDLLHGSEYVLTYQDKDGDWMLVGDVPWEMFTESCKRLRIMKGSDAIGLAPRTMHKCKNQN